MERCSETVFLGAKAKILTCLNVEFEQFVIRPVWSVSYG